MARILIIDDEDLVRLTLRQMLEKAGHDVVEASNGAEGIQKCEADSPELVITDIIMPQKEGIETIIHLHDAHPKVKIIAISGGGRTGNMDYLKLAGDLGVRHVMAKPFSADELQTMVSDALAVHHDPERHLPSTQ